MDDFGDILKGGFKDYLDLLAYKEVTAIDRKPLREEVQTVVKSPETGRTSQTGVPSTPIFGIPAMWIMGGGLVAVALLVLLLRR